MPAVGVLPLRKFARRNRVALLTAGLFVAMLVLLVGIVVSNLARRSGTLRQRSWRRQKEIVATSSAAGPSGAWRTPLRSSTGC